MVLERPVDEAELLESSAVVSEELLPDDELLEEESLEELLPDDEPDDVVPLVVLVPVPLVGSSPVDASGATNPVEGASVSMKNGLSSMQAGRSTRPKISRFIRISLSRRRWWAR